MPDTSTSWEDLTLALSFIRGINKTDATAYVTDPIPATDQHLIAAKQALRTRLMDSCGMLAAFYNDREEFFDAIADLGATDTDPIYEDLGYALACFWWMHYHGTQKISADDRQQVQQDEMRAEGNLAARALCKVLGLELGKTDRTPGSTRTAARLSKIHSYQDWSKGL